MDATKFGLFIAEMRKEKHMTQAQLASKIQVTDKAVSRWERGLGFPDINSLEPLAESLGVSVLELMKSERIEESNIQCGDANIIVADTIKAAEYQRQLERKKEKNIIWITIGLIVLISTYIVLFDNLGWTIDNIMLISFVVIIPIISILASISLFIISIIRGIAGKTYKRTLIAALVFVGIIVAMVILIFIIGFFAFPGQR